MKASEAYMITRQAKHDNHIKEMEEVNQKIKNVLLTIKSEAEMGHNRLSVSLSKDKEVNEIVKRKFKELGYTVSQYGDSFTVWW